MAKRKRSLVSTRRVGSVDPVTSAGWFESDLDQATRLIEVERAQIGHEIHDGLLPLLFAASATVASVIDHASATMSDDQREKLDQTAGWLHDAMQTGRRLLTQVYPPELTGTLWTKAAEDALKRLFAGSEAHIRWQVDPSVNDASAAIAFAAYRIVIEAVRNAVGHGKATEVVIGGEKENGKVRITIEDNGGGFDPSQVGADRFGIRAMMGRAQLVHGSLVVDSTPGGPTTVTFWAEPAAA